MVGLKPKDIRAMNPKEKQDKLKELKEELMHERGVASMGGAPMSPGKIRSLRMSIARMLTIIGEDSRAEAKKVTGKKAKKPKKVKTEETPEKRPEVKAAPKKPSKKVPKKEKKAPKKEK